MTPVSQRLDLTSSSSPGPTAGWLEWAATHGFDLETHDEDPGVPCLAKGVSPRGRHHAVVWDRGLAFDPHPSRAGLVGAPTMFATLLPVAP